MREVFLPTDRVINWCGNPSSVQRSDLLAEQIPRSQLWVRLPNRGRVVTQAVMTLGKDGHAVDMRSNHGLGESFGIPLREGIGNMWRGVKIEMNLTAAQRMVSHVSP